jgi:hypothetical protein
MKRHTRNENKIKHYTREEFSRMSPRERQKATANATTNLIKGVVEGISGFFENRRQEKEERARLERERIERENRRKRRLFITKIVLIVGIITIITSIIILMVVKADFFHDIGNGISGILNSIGIFFVVIGRAIKNFFVYILTAIKGFFMSIPGWIKGIFDFFRK